MTKREVLDLFNAIASVYPAFGWDQVKLDQWHRLLKDQDFESTQQALDSYMLDNRFPPTIADIRVKPSGASLNVPDLAETKEYINKKLAEGSEAATGNHPARQTALEEIKRGLGIR
ncbi:replicative helicase loader/inhibitor [Jeotgalibacillus aurantiacus]|uniref:replicative helicase loader/inhibitor n=1 Tax=Jeotgalibacillus aurantiacus TaxID=2763266 RepID=UPI001D0B28E2|nr:replicative helicase loader/inhibitor [Jeotgalibacillus aurantiacus]